MWWCDSNTLARRPAGLPLLAPNAIRQLRDNQVLVLRRNVRPILGVIRPVWERPDLKRLRKQERKTASQQAKQLVAKPAPKAIPQVTGEAKPLRPIVVLNNDADSDPIAVGES